MQSCYLLDVAAYDAYAMSGILIFLIFILACVLVEATAVKLINQTTFKKAFLTSLGVNAISTLVGFVVLPLTADLEVVKALSDAGRFGILFAATFLIELLLLRLFIRSVSWGKATVTSLVMNLITYGILYLLLATVE